MSMRPTHRHCRHCLITTDHMRSEERTGPSSVRVRVTCCECGHTRSWTSGAPYDPRYDEEYHGSHAPADDR